MRRLILAAAAAAIALPAAPALAQYGGSPDDQQDYQPLVDQRQDQVAKDEESGPADEYYEDEADNDPDPDYDRDQDGRAYCRRSDGTTGLVVGAGAGALVGRGIDRRGERGTGTILGAIAGALIGSAVERGARCEQR